MKEIIFIPRPLLSFSTLENFKEVISDFWLKNIQNSQPLYLFKQNFLVFLFRAPPLPDPMHDRNNELSVPGNGQAAGNSKSPAYHQCNRWGLAKSGNALEHLGADAVRCTRWKGEGECNHFPAKRE